MITSSQITNTEIFAFIAVLGFQFLSHKVLFINRRDNRNFLRKWQILRVTRKPSFISAFSVCMTVPLSATVHFKKENWLECHRYKNYLKRTIHKYFITRTLF